MMRFVQSLKGAAASVLLALAFTGRHMSHKELRLWTHCGKNQVSLGLQTLVHQGMIAGRTSRGPWALTQVLPGLPMDVPAEGNPLKGLSSSSDSLNTTKEETLLLSPRRRELLEAMYRAGIREPTASELSELPHVTLEYLQAHVSGARAHGLVIGSAIEAMRMGAPAPMRPPSNNRQAEVEEKMRRFIEGR
jgi:hypothetical protein